MSDKEQKKQEYYEALVQNAEKGERYLLKLKDNPGLFITIPLIRPGFEGGGENMFTFKVIEPKEMEGMYKRPLDDIEILERQDV